MRSEKGSAGGKACSLYSVVFSTLHSNISVIVIIYLGCRTFKNVRMPVSLHEIYAIMLSIFWDGKHVTELEVFSSSVNCGQ